MTIRKDLELLKRRRLLRRVRGGAVRTEYRDEGAFELRLLHRAEVKRAIAREAARLVRDGDAIALDCSTTCYYLAEQLRDRQGQVVVTTGLRAAELLGSSAAVVLTGGTLRPSSWSLVSDNTDFPVRGGPLTRGFFGVSSVSPAHGLLELSSEEGAAKHRRGAACREVYALSNTDNKWYQFIDEYGVRGYVPFETTGLNSGRWTPSSNHALPARPRQRSEQLSRFPGL